VLSFCVGLGFEHAVQRGTSSAHVMLNWCMIRCNLQFLKNNHNCCVVASSCFRVMKIVIAVMSSIICWVAGTGKFCHILPTVQTWSAPCEFFFFFLFPYIKGPLKGCRFESADTNNSAIMPSLRWASRVYYRATVGHVPQQWRSAKNFEQSLWSGGCV
jgi:hypothetical protein